MKTLIFTALLTTSVVSEAIEYRSQRLNIPSGAGSFKFMNNTGEVAYSYSSSSTPGAPELFILHRNGETTSIPVIPNSHPLRHYGVSGMSDDGTIFGFYSDDFFETNSYFTWHMDRGYQFLPSTLSYSSMNDQSQLAIRDAQGREGTYNYETSAIDYFQPGNGASITYLANNGWAVSHLGLAQIWHNGQVVPFQAAGTAKPRRISDTGFAVGGGSAGQSAIIWNPDGTVRNAFALGQAAGFSMINTQMIALGGYRLSPTETRTLYYSPQTGLRHFEELITQRDEFLPLQWTSELQNSGMLLGGLAIRDGENYEERHYLLTPVPEPGTVLALGAGLAALLRRRRTT